MSPNFQAVTVGTRLSIEGELCTVLYVGKVGKSPEEWFGVEWDRPGRGRHDGSVDGVRYFSTRSKCCERCQSTLPQVALMLSGFGSPPLSTAEQSVSDAGSFVKSSKKEIDCGRRFVEALREKYLDVAGPTEQTVWGGKVVERVGFEKIEAKVSKLQELKIVSLSGLRVASAGPSQEIAEATPSILELDLSKNLVPDWKTISAITVQLPRLKTLNVSFNRMLINDVEPLSFSGVSELCLNSTLSDIGEIGLLIEREMPKLAHLHFALNRVSEIPLQAASLLRRIRILNLEGNPFTSWDGVKSLAVLPMLEILNLSQTPLESIEYGKDEGFAALRMLSIHDCKISQWSSFDAMDRMPSLTELRVRGNPVFGDMRPGAIRTHVIARMGKLKSLNGSDVLPSERADSERYILGRLDSLPAPLTQQQLDRLFEAHGKPEALQSSNAGAKKGPSLLKLKLLLSNGTSRDVKLPAGMQIRKLRPMLGAVEAIEFIRPEGMRIRAEDESRDLSYYGEDGDTVEGVVK